MVRWTAVISVAFGAGVFLFYLHMLGKSPWEPLEARHLRAMKERLATPVSAEPMTHAELFALPQHRNVAEYSGIERRAVVIEGTVRHMLRATDGDLHLELYPDTTADHYYVTAEITPGWRGRGVGGPADSAGWGYERLASVFRVRHGVTTAWAGGPARVRLTGWLLYDANSDVLPRLLGIPLEKRPTDWEIHPVTKIERWDDSLAAWTEVLR